MRACLLAIVLLACGTSPHTTVGRGREPLTIRTSAVGVKVRLEQGAEVVERRAGRARFRVTLRQKLPELVEPSRWQIWLEQGERRFTPVYKAGSVHRHKELGPRDAPNDIRRGYRIDGFGRRRVVYLPLEPPDVWESTIDVEFSDPALLADAPISLVVRDSMELRYRWTR